MCIDIYTYMCIYIYIDRYTISSINQWFENSQPSIVSTRLPKAPAGGRQCRYRRPLQKRGPEISWGTGVRRKGNGMAHR